jgi:hypothetical protein
LDTCPPLFFFILLTGGSFIHAQRASRCDQQLSSTALITRNQVILDTSFFLGGLMLRSGVLQRLLLLVLLR